jgi:hypothetical protein
VFGQTEERRNYRYFNAVRDKHVAHDVNSMRILEPVALIGDGPGRPLDSIQYFVLIRPLDYQNDVPKMRALLATATKYVQVQINSRTDIVAKLIMNMTPEQRGSLPDFNGSNIVLKDVDQSR